MKKYFITSAEAGKSEEHLDQSRELPAYERRGEPIVVSERVEHSALLSVPTKVAHLFLAAYPPFVYHARPITALDLLILPSL